AFHTKISQEIDRTRQTGGSFLDIYHAHIHDKLSLRGASFAFLFDLLCKMGKNHYRILETGGLRKPNNFGDGQSTALFDWFVRVHGGFVWTIDNNIAVAQTIEKIGLQHTHVVCADSVVFLDHMRHMGMTQGWDVIYLDSMDSNISPEKLLPQAHSLKETSALGHLPAGTIVVFDDSIQNGPILPKDFFASRYAETVGWKLLFSGYQVIWQVR
ncbi:MAG: hypothetical protein AAF352_05935, partial [Pseudomonadota bacterium]